MLQSNKTPAQENTTMTKPINWNRRKYTQQQFEQAWQQAETLYEVTQILGFKTVSKNLYTTLRKTAVALQLEDKFDAYELANDPQRLDHRKLSAILEQENIKYSCKTCGIDTWLDLPLTLHVDHIDGDYTNNTVENLRYLCPNCHSQTKTFGRGIPDYSKRPLQPLNRIYKKPHEAVFAKNTKYDKPVRTRIINECLITYKCGICNICTYNNTHLNLQIDHIDGDRTNNELTNLRFLCPNCHSQTDTYCGKNVDSSSFVREQRKCSSCLAPISRRSKSGLCMSCLTKAHKQTPKSTKNDVLKLTPNTLGIRFYPPSKRPEKEELIEKIIEKNFVIVQVGLHYNVSDNTVRKWCRFYGIDPKKNKIRQSIFAHQATI